MIGTNMLQTTLHPTCVPRRRRWMLSGSRPALYALGACAGMLLALSTAAHAQGAAANPPRPAPPAATPGDVGKQLFPNPQSAPLPNMQTPTPPTEVPGAKQGASEAGKQLFPGAPKNPVPASPEALTAPPAQGAGDTRGLDQEIQGLKKDVVDLNKDLFILEEELLFPANTQVALFVSMDVGVLFQLDSVQIKLDDKVVANYLYTQLEVDALHRGGVQRVYLGNLKTGQHELVAYFTGKGPHERNYRRGANVKFEKTTDAKYIELRIQDSTGKLQPEFDIKLWQ